MNDFRISGAALCIVLTLGLTFGFSSSAGAAIMPVVDGELLEGETSQQSALDVVNDERLDEPDRGELEEEELQAWALAMRSALEAEEAHDYEQARDDFVRAYQIFPHSNVLLSVARVSANLGDSEVALAGYERFLQRRPDYENRQEIEERIAALQPEAEEEREPIDFAQFMPSNMGWLGVGAVVVGTVSMIGGGRAASRVDDDFELLQQARQQEDRDEYLRLESDISSRQTRGKVFLYGGMALTAAGVGLVVYDLFLDEPSLSDDTQIPTARLEVEPLVGQGFFMRWTMSF